LAYPYPYPCPYPLTPALTPTLTSRKKSVMVENLWTHLLFETDAAGRLAPRDRQVLAEQPP